MGEMDFGAAVPSNLSSTITEFDIDAAPLDSPQDTKETPHTFNDFDRQLGYFNEIPELNAVINAKATWTIGKGFTADESVTFICDSISGWGKDSFNTILENMIRIYYIGGDAFAEIIRDDDENLINLKPLNTANIKIITNRKGRLIRYEYINRTKDGKANLRIAPEKMFHLARNRMGDEIHGRSMITPLEKIIRYRNGAMKNQNIIFERYVAPRWIIKLDTADPTKISSFKTKMDKLNADGENLYIPQGSVELEQMSIAPNSTLNVQPWIDSLNNYFYEASGVPKIIVGGANEFTEATAKIVYLAFQQSVEEEQLFIEEQVGLQLGLEIELTFPASLENELLSDNKKDKTNGAAQPGETTAGVGQ